MPWAELKNAVRPGREPYINVRCETAAAPSLVCFNGRKSLAKREERVLISSFLQQVLRVLVSKRFLSKILSRPLSRFPRRPRRYIAVSDAPPTPTDRLLRMPCRTR